MQKIAAAPAVLRKLVGSSRRPSWLDLYHGSMLSRVRKLSLYLILLVVCLWGYSNYRADHYTFAWDRPVRVLILAVVDPRTDAAEEARQGFLQRFLTGVVPGKGNLPGIQQWF